MWGGGGVGGGGRGGGGRERNLGSNLSWEWPRMGPEERVTLRAKSGLIVPSGNSRGCGRPY